MERTKKKTEDTPLWKKIGGGSLRINKRIIKPGQVFAAEHSEIPNAFKDVIIPHNALAKKEAKEEITDSTFTLSMVEKGKWNVVDSEGKVVNDEPVAKGVAQKLIDELEK